MISGAVSEEGEPLVKIKVRGLRSEADIEAIVDTGFNGHLCLPTEIAVQLGLELCAVERCELADGTIQST